MVFTHGCSAEHMRSGLMLPWLAPCSMKKNGNYQAFSACFLAGGYLLIAPPAKHGLVRILDKNR